VTRRQMLRPLKRYLDAKGDSDIFFMLQEDGIPAYDEKEHGEMYYTYDYLRAYRRGFLDMAPSHRGTNSDRSRMYLTGYEDGAGDRALDAFRTLKAKSGVRV
jgi:hypothetical protein